MKSVLIVAIAFVLLIPLTVFAQQYQVSVQTDDNHYDEGDTIVISGQVSTSMPGVDVVIQLFTEGNMVTTAQKPIAQDGTFSHTILAEGPLWKKSGTYLVRASYEVGGVTISETEFTYSSKSEVSEITTNFEVNAGSHGTFDVKYSILGGTVQKIVLDTDFTIIVQISSTDEGYLIVELPRAVIGAEKQNGVDDTFIVLIDGVDVAYNQTDFDFVSRVIKVNFEQGDSDIKIFGTYVLENQQNITDPIEEGWTSVDDLPVRDEEEDPDVIISRLKEEIKDLKLENRELKLQIEDMKNILMEQIRVIMKWFS